MHRACTCNAVAFALEAIMCVYVYDACLHDPISMHNLFVLMLSVCRVYAGRMLACRMHGCNMHVYRAHVTSEGRTGTVGAD